MKTSIYLIAFMLLCNQSSYADGSVDCHFMDWESPETPCVYKVGDEKLHIFPSGKIRVSTASKVEEVRVTLPGQFYIESAKYEAVGNSIVFVFGITDAEEGSSILVFYDKNKNNIIWQIEVGAFNASEPLVGIDAIYIGAIGTIAKVDRNTGSILWIHRNLYERDTQAFNAFVRPTREGHLIKFVESKVSTAKYSGIREIVVDDMSGEILNK